MQSIINYSTHPNQKFTKKIMKPTTHPKYNRLNTNPKQIQIEIQNKLLS